MRLSRLVLAIGMGLLVSGGPAAWAEASSVLLKFEKFIDPYIGMDGDVRYLPKLYIEHPGATSVAFNIFDKRADTAMSYDDLDGEWFWEPEPPPVDAWDYTFNELNDQYSGYWTLTLDASLPTESVYSFTLNPLQYADFASTPEFCEPTEGEEHPANYAFKWRFREGQFVPPGCNLSMSVNHDATDNDVEVDSRWADPDHIDLMATSQTFPAGTLLPGESMLRVQYSRYDENRLVGFMKVSGEAIAWDGPPQLKLQAGQNISCDVMPTAVNNGGFDPTNPIDPLDPFAGWTIFGPDYSVTAVQNPFDLPEDYVPQFTAYSPGGMTQIVDTPSGPFFVLFDYGWTAVPTPEDMDAIFTVYIDGVAVGTLVSPDAPDTDWQQGEFAVFDAGLWELIGVELGLEVDGPTGSSLVVDNLQFSNLPEPASLALLGFGAVAFALRRRHQA